VSDVDDRAKLLWRLSSSGFGTTLTANGNSGGYTPAVNICTAVDLRRVTDLALMVYVGGTVAATSSLVVNLDTYDAAGNLFPAVLSIAAITATTTGKVAYGGLFSGGTAQIVFPEWGRISWAVTGTTPSLAGVEISLYGR
jgi:hypothetical protein